jgi:NAD(P)-dependent dehydrogenase (short-subunit alcohol dehydrogenase family)
VSRPFDARVALVTGGGTGIGAAITAQQADKAAVALAAPGRAISGVGGDLADAQACNAIVAEVIARHGRIDILVNNAGITGPPATGAFLDFTDAHLDAIIDVNLKAAFRCGREAARDMAARGGGGVIVHISSVGAFAAQHRASAYVAAKAGLVGLTKAMAFELAPHGVRVVAIAPGDIDVSDPPHPENGTPLRTQWWERNTPLGRRGVPDDIASMVTFICSDAASFVTGQTIIVDGGWLTY